MTLPNYNVEKQNIMDYRHSDVLEYMSTLPDKSMDLIILDPPYYKVTKNKWDHQWKTREEYNEWCTKWILECARVAKRSANLWLFGYLRNIPHSYCSLTDNGFTFRQQIVVQKPMRTIVGRTKADQKIYPTITESIFHFHMESRPYIAELLEQQRIQHNMTTRAINRHLGLSTSGGGAYSGYVNKNNEKMVYPKREHWEKLSTIFTLPNYDDVVYMFNIEPGLRDVWSDIDFYLEKRIHPTQKPQKLIQRIINTCTTPGMNVLDPFGGSGATAMACKELNRNCYSCEIDEEYYEESTSRLHNASYNLSTWFST